MVWRGHAQSWLVRLKEGLGRTREALTQPLTELIRRGGRIDQEFYEEMEAALLAADVGLPTTERLIARLQEEVRRRQVTDRAGLAGLLRQLIGEQLDSPGAERLTPVLRQGPEAPTVYLFVGVNGAGKTSTIGKLAGALRREGASVLVAAADTFRAAAAEQLAVWAERSGADIVRHQEGSDPAAVAYDAIQAARARKIEYVLIDTAGRLQTRTNLMEELKKIGRVVQRELGRPADEVLLVLDATIGQNGISQARLFGQAVGVTGIVLTKLDGTAKGGVVLAIASELGIPVKLVGTGEGEDDLQPFDPQDFARALLPDEVGESRGGVNG